MSTKLIDDAGRVRQGEEIDAHKIAEYLQNKVLGLNGIPEIKQFKGGASNLTYRLDFEDISYILRRPPIGKKAKGAHNMKREHDVMQKLKPHYPYVPEMIAYSGDESIIGSEFYVMEKFTGLIPRANLPKDLNATPELVRAMCMAAIDKLVELHQVDYQAAGFEDYYKGPGYVKRQVLGWSKRYRNAVTPDVPSYESVMTWLEEQMPDDLAPCIIHNDFRFDNLVYDAQDPTKVFGVLDWEMATVGDPMMDLGGSLAYWIEAKDPACWRLIRRQPTHEKGMFGREELMEYYLSKMNLEVENQKFYYIFGVFRLAVIIQQIYYRYYHKQTKNPAFKTFGVASSMLEQYCKKLIKSPSQNLSQYPLSFFDNLYYSIRFALKQNAG